MMFLAMACFSLGLFIKLTWELHEDGSVTSLDGLILTQIGKFRMARLNGPAVDITALGSPTVMALICLIAFAILWLLRNRRGATFLFLSAAGAGLGVTLLKLLIQRPRPNIIPHLVEVTDYSYPSGHTIASTAVFLSLALLASRHFTDWKERAVLFLIAGILIGLVAFSRLYLGVHYPSDVLSGLLLGSGWTFSLAVFLFAKPPKGKNT